MIVFLSPGPFSRGSSTVSPWMSQRVGRVRLGEEELLQGRQLFHQQRDLAPPAERSCPRCLEGPGPRCRRRGSERSQQRRRHGGTHRHGPCLALPHRDTRTDTASPPGAAMAAFSRFPSPAEPHPEEPLVSAMLRRNSLAPASDPRHTRSHPGFRALIMESGCAKETTNLGRPPVSHAG